MSLYIKQEIKHLSQEILTFLSFLSLSDKLEKVTFLSLIMVVSDYPILRENFP